MASMLLATVRVILILVVVVIAVVLMRFNLAALPEPGRLETGLANSARFLVRRASRHGIPPLPQDRKASAAQGDKLYGLKCHVSRRRWPRTERYRVLDVSARSRSDPPDGQGYSDPDTDHGPLGRR